MSKHLLAIDTETALIQRALLAPPISCLTYCWEDKDPDIIVYHNKKELYEFIKAWFQLKYVHIIAHNAAYDMAVICAEWPSLIPIIFQAYEEGRIHCTRIRQKLLDIALGYLGSDEPGEKNKGWYTNSFDKKRYLIKYSLSHLHYRRTGEQLEKGDVRMQFGPLRNIPLKVWPEGSIEYAKKDAEVLIPLYKEQEEYAQYLEDEAAQVRAAFALHLISAWGFRTDPIWVDRLTKETQKTLDSYKPRLLKLDWLDEKGVLKKEPAQKYLWKLCHERNIAPKLTKKGKKEERPTHKHMALDEEACERINDPDLTLRQKFNSIRTVMSKDIPMLQAGFDLPIQASFESLLATGRTSSYASKTLPIVGGNIQNFRRLPGIRECVIPREGRVLGSCDYSGAELHTLAQVCYTFLGKSRLGDILNEGKDPHLDMAAQILNITYTTALERKEYPEVEETRQFAKIANFGFPGGMVGTTLSDYAKGYNVDITPEQGKFFRIKWLENFPEMEEYFEHIKDLCRSGEPIRHLFSNRCRGRIRYTVACNSFFQGLAADGAKAALWRLTRCMYEKGYNGILYGTRMINFPHDEVIFETKDEYPKSSRVAFEISRIMAEEFNRFVPLCPTIAEPVLMRRWGKNAKQIFKDGNLIPWDCDLEETFNGMDNKS